MILTAKQEEGLKIAVERYKNHERWTTISGYAGSGKSTLIKFIIAALDIDPENDVCYIAFTGKAANVLTQKGCPNAVTAHKLLYYAKQMPNGKYSFSAKKKLDNEYKVIVVDEVSMLPKPMWDLLLSHKVYILACGDPGQLPPIDPENDNHVLDNPHVFLDEVMRQAQDSEIIRLSMWIREGNPLGAFPCQKEQVQLFGKHEVVEGMYGWADQILCATNNKRIEINNIVRRQKGFGEEPAVGDKVISLKNHWDDISDNGNWALTNGTIGSLTYLAKESLYLPPYICDKTVPVLNIDMNIEGENDSFSFLTADYKCLKEGTPTLSPKQIFQINKMKCGPRAPYDFAYAYAITTHKAQGSEWPKVLIFEEWFPNVAEEHKRWLYTAITRASEKVVVIKK